MTREEIISGLKFTIEMFLFDPNTGETFTEPRNDMDKTTIDACRGAIELLEQEPITKNDLAVDNQNIRLIDANALIKRLRPKHFDWWGEGEQDDFSKGNNSMLEEVIEAIEEFSSVTPIRPKGHWINIDKTHSKCDKCESVFEIVSANGESNYCPNCGCFMSEGGEE